MKNEKELDGGREVMARVHRLMKKYPKAPVRLRVAGTFNAGDGETLNITVGIASRAFHLGVAGRYEDVGQAIFDDELARTGKCLSAKELKQKRRTLEAKGAVRNYILLTVEAENEESESPGDPCRQDDPEQYLLNFEGDEVKE